ncbi:aminoglycoside phosphotransferase family protein [Arcanobacterium hippocoleae]|uniref:Aminoglycoside phosphotransferase n=1 Tax=Arcanobacterium hippocoleae TaxID=149017 RepID=A0ABU1T430_9ACTO|nr:aminoglycoside phosphotransferase family protein [Arcanobacterium hippocoleae]MDR6940016.1 aminoglycoside phosphotransferase [Arcanobacterium hippocoleae]
MSKSIPAVAAVRPNPQRAQQERTDLALLTSQRAGEMLRLAYADLGILRSWKVHQVHHRPGAGVCVGYSIVVDTNPPFARRDLYVLAATAKIQEEKVLEVGGKRLRLGKTAVNIWEYPYDPELPALALACDVEKMSAYLGQPVELELIGYRPTRRAVVRVDRVDHRPLFAKVIRPSMQQDFEYRLQIMQRARIACPQIYAREVGIVLMTAIPGVPLSRVLAQSSRRTPSEKRITKTAARTILRDLEEISAALPQTAIALRERPAWVDRCEHYASAAALTLPKMQSQCTQIAKDIRYLLARADLGPKVPTHGDFYEANIYIDPQTRKICGLLDLDSLGPGYRVHDWGCLLGHMSVLPTLAPKIYDGVAPIVDDWYELLGFSVDPVALAASAAGTALSLVAGARKSRAGWNTEAINRLTAAQSWVERGFTQL